ncbi:DENN domain containing pinstripe isoform X2 [Brevipalpus obovatus]|uniref:DENN domain containing pinstripe isoform X2 n=1 Tax=Brevipalpus obovatus TaxID=246614 RepID=UPI003D9DDD59
MSTPKKRDKQKLIKCFVILKPSEKDIRKISVAAKYCTTLSSSLDGKNFNGGDKNDSSDVKSTESVRSSIVVDDIDENSLSLFCLPDGCEIRSSQSKPTFHTFLITKQNGTRIYGSSLMIWDRLKSPENNGKFTNKAFCFLTNIPLIVATHKLLLYIWENNCSMSMVQNICNLKMPSRGKCLKLTLPRNTALFHSKSNNIQPNNSGKYEEIYIYRGLPSFPLYDYPLRQLFTEVLSPDQFLIAFVATLLEFQIILVSESYFNLMMVAEALTSLLLPFSWQHVYVPILPSKLGLNFLDAPTPYIMGINSRCKDVPSLSSLFAGSTANSIQCRVDCDSNRVDYYADENSLEDDVLLTLPPFIEELKGEIEAILFPDARSQAIKPQSEALRRISEMARKQRFNDTCAISYLDDLKLNQSLRIAFLKCIQRHILREHEKFIVFNLNRREAAAFDAVSFLCDQSDSIRNFLAKFLKTQMFVSFIDDHVKRVHKNKHTEQLNSHQSTQNAQASHNESILNNDADPEDEGQFIQGDTGLESKFNDPQVIQFTEDVDSLHSSMAVGMADFNGPLLASPVRQRRSRTSLDETKTGRNRRVRGVDGSNLGENSSRSGSESNLASPVRVPTALAAQTNWKVVESLLREVKVGTKRILLAKMGNDEIAPLGFGSPEDTEENTLIATLCGLIERIWSHARSNDKETVRCPFWSHVLAFIAIHGDEEENPQIDSASLTPALSRMSIESTTNSQSTPPSPAKHRQNNDYLKPVPNTFNHAFKCIQSMVDIKTDTGKSRAFIRLALERKLLSKHLRVLLSNQDLVMSIYRRYAFLRCEEEREQFLTHLLTLNAVDILCFTHTYPTTSLTYTLVFEGSGPLTGSIWLGGSLRHSNEIIISNANNVYSFEHTNLGFINTLAILIDTNVTSSLYIGYCFIRNEVTGHIFKFPCDHWFGKKVEDGAIERILVGDILNNASIGDVLKIKKNQRSSSIGRQINQTRGSNRDERLGIQELQQKLVERINEIVRFYYNTQPISLSNGHNSGTRKLPARHIIKHGQAPTSSSFKHSSSNLQYSFSNSFFSPQKTLVSLIYGEKQFLWTLMQIFYYGFKKGLSYYRKKFLWDYLDQVVRDLNKSEEVNAKMLINVTKSIDSKASSLGKDDKFGLFLIIALRDHFLTKALDCLFKSGRTHEFYDANSFLRQGPLRKFLSETLSTLNDMNLIVTPALTKGL